MTSNIVSLSMQCYDVASALIRYSFNVLCLLGIFKAHEKPQNRPFRFKKYQFQQNGAWKFWTNDFILFPYLIFAWNLKNEFHICEILLIYVIFVVCFKFAAYLFNLSFILFSAVSVGSFLYLLKWKVSEYSNFHQFSGKLFIVR